MIKRVWPAIVVLVLITAVGLDGDIRHLLAIALARVSPMAVLVTLPVQMLAIIVCVWAQMALKPGVTFMASFASRLVRDAASHLIVLPPGAGDAIGARMLVLAGGSVRGALSVRALDILAEVLGQLPFMALAFAVLWGLGQTIGWPQVALPGAKFWIAGALVAIVLVVALAKFAPLGRWWRQFCAEAALFLHELRLRWAGMPLAVGLHFIGWGLSGVQLWLAAKVFGMELSFYGAMALEGAASSSRIILFFVPGGLVAQEAAIIAAGLAFALAPAQALALALVLRIRDLVFGLGLLWWPYQEWRVKRFAADQQQHNLHK